MQFHARTIQTDKMTPKDIEKYQNRYNEQDFLKKVTRAARKAGIKVVYLALILYYVLKSPKVKTADKGKIWGALGYFILPIDIIPDFIPVAGYTDDLAALLWAFYQAKQKLHDWFGDYDEAEITIEKNPKDGGDVDVQG